MPHKPVWYAVYTSSRAEKKVARELEQIKIEYYLPLQSSLRQWSDRKKKVEVPLISSYIFVRITTKEYFPVLQVPGVVKIIHFAGRPVPIPDWEINNLRILTGNAIAVRSSKAHFEKGQEVQITRGSLKGLIGIIVHHRGRNKLVIRINALNYNLTLDIDPAFVEKGCKI